jgi:excinuclease ABC subunit A
VAAAIDGEANHAYEFAATGPFSPHLIPLFSVDSNLTRLVAHDLGVNDPLAKLFASSQQAKMLGLTPRDLIIGQARVSASICRTCRGAGLLLTEEDSVLSGASLCTSCWGARWSSPARDITFRGKTMWQLLNSPIRETAPVLRALPKMSQILELVTLLDLVDIPLGMPTSLLSRTNRRLLSVIKATISATPSRPSLVIIEEPYVGLTEQQISGLAEVALHSYTKPKVAWIAVSGS